MALPKTTTTKRRRRRNVFDISSLNNRDIESLAQFFVLMQYETDSPSAYCTVLSKCRRQETEGLGTMAVTLDTKGGYRLLYDPVFNDMVRDPENRETVRMILVHEFIHLQDSHVARSITLYESEQDKEIFKKVNPIAVDFACNSTAVKWGLYTVESLLSGKPHIKDEAGEVVKDDQGREVGKWRGCYPTEEPFNLPPNLSYERYYSILKGILKDKVPKEWKKGEGQSSDSGQAPNDESKDPGTGDLSERMERCKEALNQSGKGGKKRFVHIEDLDLESMSEEDREALKQEAERLTDEINLALLDQLKSRGLGKGNLALDIESRLAPPQVPWQQLFRSFVKNASLRAKPKKSIRHTNRRKEDNGMWSPFPGKVKDRKIKALLAFDTSGSVSPPEFEEIRNEALALHGLLGDITVIYCDTQIAHIEKLTDSSELPKKRYGCGGTSFDPPFQWAIDTKFKPDVIIYGTDGECPLPPEYLRMNVPVLWLISSRGCLPGSSWYSRNKMESGKMYETDYGSALKLNSL